MDVLDDLALKTRMPGFELVGRYKAAAPIYKVRARTSVLRTKYLPTISEFALRLVADGCTSELEIATILGISSDFVRAALSFLNQLNLISLVAQGATRGSVNLVITERGKQALLDSLAAVERELVEIFVDGLTGKCSSSDGCTLRSAQSLKKEGDYYLLQVVNGARPDIDLLNANMVDIQCILDNQMDEMKWLGPSHQTGKNRQSSVLNRLIEVTEIVDSWLQYKHVNMLVFRHRENGHVQMRSFEGFHPLEEYDQVLTNQFRSGKTNVVPKHLLVTKHEADATEIDPALAAEVERITALHSRIVDSASKIEDAERTIAAIDQYAGPEELTAKSRRIKELESSLGHLRVEKAEVERQLGSTRLVLDFEHRELLKRALTDSCVSVVIFSPFITRYAVDKEIIKLINDCVRRNVHVAIAYGMKPRPNQRFIDADVQADFDQITRSKYGKMLHIENIAGTHEKILVCDNKFCVVTSNNFLSFNGDYKIKHETGVYSESAELIKKLRDRTKDSFKHLSAFPADS